MGGETCIAVEDEVFAVDASVSLAVISVGDGVPRFSHAGTLQYPKESSVFVQHHARFFLSGVGLRQKLLLPRLAWG